MKLILTSMLLLAFTNVFANCNSDMETGFEMAKSAADRMVDATDFNNQLLNAIKYKASNDEICDLAYNARSEGYEATKYANTSGISFKAVTTSRCSESNEAKEKRIQVKKDFDQNKTFVERLDKLMMTACQDYEQDLSLLLVWDQV